MKNRTTRLPLERLERPERRALLGAIAILAGLALAFVGTVPTAGADDQPNPYTRPNDTWISISGKVKSVRPDTFMLDYGDGTVVVEMDDGDRDADAYKLMPGDSVTVNGKIDDDFYETTSIEASSVYVEKLGTYFFASPIDEEDAFFYSVTTPVIVSALTVQGTVTEVEGDEFVVDTGLRKLRVDVDEMPYDPLDDEGYQKIEVGDYVKVTGNLDDGFFEGRRLEAKSVIELSG
jgi:uncharacterized protein YdeI (BOF family)